MRFADRRNPARQIEINSPHELGIGRGLDRVNAVLLPMFAKFVIDALRQLIVGQWLVERFPVRICFTGCVGLALDFGFSSAFCAGGFFATGAATSTGGSVCFAAGRRLRGYLRLSLVAAIATGLCVAFASVVPASSDCLPHASRNRLDAAEQSPARPPPRPADCSKWPPPSTTDAAATMLNTQRRRERPPFHLPLTSGAFRRNFRLLDCRLRRNVPRHSSRRSRLRTAAREPLHGVNANSASNR